MSSSRIAVQTATAENGYKVEFAVWRLIVKDVQLRPRVTTHEHKRRHSESMYFRGHNVGTANFTSTDTSVSVDEDTRLLAADVVDQTEYEFDLHNVRDGYYRGDLLLNIAWRRPGHDKWRDLSLHNLSRRARYNWWITREEVRGASSRGILPAWLRLPAIIVASFTVTMPFAWWLLRLVFTMLGWTGMWGIFGILAGGFFLGLWLGRRLVDFGMDWWHSPIDRFIGAIYKAGREVAAAPPAAPATGSTASANRPPFFSR